MRLVRMVAVCGLVMAGVAGAAKAGAPKAKALKVTIKDGAGKDVGTAAFKTVADGVQVKISLHNFMLGDHGVHIHQNATCEGPDFKTAGGHFNPDMKKHGFESADGHHNGDFPGNIKVIEGNMGEATFVLKSVTMDPAAANSLFANGGTSIVVHEKADDMKTDPSGASGNRIACGVIKQ